MAIESTNFFSFLQQTRSPIGLVDQYNLSEIYDSDQRDALRNLLLDPEGLDQISGLSKQGIQKEDLRLIGGLDSPVIDSLALFDDTDSSVSFDLSTMVRIGDPVGEPGKQSFVSDTYSDNIIILHGGLAAKNIEYDFVNEYGEISTTSVSTSRESLFNSQVNESTGQYTLASYPGLLRVRRRSHLNELKLNSKLFVEKSGIVESPSARINIPIYMRTGANTSPSVISLQSYATKNSPFVLPIRVTGAKSFTLGPNESQANDYYFGYEIKRKSDLAPVISAVYTNSKASTNVTQSFNLNGTIGNGVDCFLYIYCSAGLIKNLSLSGLGLKEDLGRDLGLVGFDNLEYLNLSNNNLSTIPVWLKVNYKTLKTLNLRGNNYWNNGIVSYFDYQTDPGVQGSANATVPPLSATQILSYSGYRSASSTNGSTDATGKIIDYDGTLSTVVDADGSTGVTSARKFIDVRKNEMAGTTTCTIDEANGFRQFTALKELNIESSLNAINADFSRVFPNITDLVMDRPSWDGSPTGVRGLLPRLRNNNQLMSYNVSYQRFLGGSLKYAALKEEYISGDDNSQFIGKWKLRSIDLSHAGYSNSAISGGICTNDLSITSGKVSSAVVDSKNRYSHVDASSSINDAWDGWLDNLEVLNTIYTDTAVNLADGSSLNWKKLKTVYVHYSNRGNSNKVVYNPTVAASSGSAIDILTGSSFNYIQAYYSGWAGRLFSIQGAKQLQTLYIGNCNWSGYENGKYMLPDNFSIDSQDLEEQNQLRNLQIYYLHDGSSKELQFREDDFLTLGKLRYVYLIDSYWSGVCPAFVDETKNTDIIDFYFRNSRFHDLSNLGTNRNNRFQTLWGPYQGTGVGGALLPSFKTLSPNNRLYNVQFYYSLGYTYPSNWNADTSKRKQPVFNMLHGDVNAPAGVVEEITSITETWTTKDEVGGSQGVSRLLEPSSSFNIPTYVRVGDKVLLSGSEVARVSQVRGSHIFVNQDLNLNGATLQFKRAGQDISDNFQNCTVLRYLYLYNCSLTGTIPNFNGNSGMLERIRFQQNMFTTYQPGTLQNITGAAVNRTSRPRLRELNLSFNPLSKTSIRAIIYDAYEIAKFYGTNLNTITLNLLSTKADVSVGALVNWTEEEIFTEGTSGTPGTPGDPNADPPTPEVPGIPSTPDPLLVKFNQLGTTYPAIRIRLFS